MEKKLKKATIKLSEAIRQGATMKPQTDWTPRRDKAPSRLSNDPYEFHSSTTTDKGSCALGAAANALGCSGEHEELIQLFPQLADILPDGRTLKLTVCMLNDVEKKTREETANILMAMGY